ncbi:hypothetical protein [Timonella sp. A28]|uniref:hypothetical protein n=1 Tax=Timonella sp. A28 TaxID=3442640 RepID=UPI003EBBBDB6
MTAPTPHKAAHDTSPDLPHRTTLPPIPKRTVLIFPAGICLIAGLSAALLLLGLPAPFTVNRLVDSHGTLLTLGFIGTLIALERSVALGRFWGYAAPTLLGTGGLLLLTPVSLIVPHACMLSGATIMTSTYVVLWQRNRDEAILIQALGAVLAAGAATLLVLQFPVRILLPWLAGFVILTICGERLELARLTLKRSAGYVVLVCACTFTALTIATLLWPTAGYPLLGLNLIVMTLWLSAHDVARKLIFTSASRRFMAACMLAGYAWLTLAGFIWLLGPAFEGAAYDAVIHAVFIGFTMSMIMAHATTILPAIVKRPLPYHPVMWLPAALMHAALIVRVWIGDGLGIRLAHQIGGLFNVISVLLFLIIIVGTAITAPTATPSPRIGKTS